MNFQARANAIAQVEATSDDPYIQAREIMKNLGTKKFIIEYLVADMAFQGFDPVAIRKELKIRSGNSTSFLHDCSHYSMSCERS